MLCSQAAERGDVLMELAVGGLGDLADRFVERQAGIFLRRPRVDLVVDVGDVADVSDLRLAFRAIPNASLRQILKQPEQHVEYDHRPRIADMGEVIDRRPAHIHAHVVRIERFENPLLARQRIVEFQFHRRIKPCEIASYAFSLLAGRVQNLDGEKRRPQPACGASE